MAAEIPLRVQLLHQLLEWQLMVAISLQRCFAHSCQQFAKRRLSAQIRTHHERVHEKADHHLQLRSQATRDWNAYGYIVLATVAVQQHLECRQQDHVQSCAGCDA